MINHLLKALSLSVTLGFAWSSLAKGASQPQVIGTITQDDGRIVLMRTDDPHLYYAVPSLWQVDQDQTIISENTVDASHYDLAFLLVPDYSWAREKEDQIKAADPQAIFLNVPRQYVNATVNVPAELGEIRSRLLPTDALSSGEIFYFRLSLDSRELGVLQTLTATHSNITGFVTYSFADGGNRFNTLSNILFNFSPRQLVPSVPIQDNFVYLRCTMTSWNNLDLAAQLIPSYNYSSTLFLDVNADQEWMVDGGDDCTFTGTSVQGQWTNVTNYMANAQGFATLGPTYGLRATPAMQTFKVKFPALGRYRLILNQKSGTFYFESAPPQLTSDRISEDTYMLVSKKDQKCLSLYVAALGSDGYQQGDSLQPADCPTGGSEWTNNYWQVRLNNDGTYQLASAYSNQCAAALTTALRFGADLAQLNCEGNPKVVRFIFENSGSGDGEYRLRNAEDGLCLTLKSDDSAYRLDRCQSLGEVTQTFLLKPAH